MNVVYNQDCMEGMKQYADNYFELAIVDPPYGIDAGNMKMGKGSGNDIGKFKKCNWDINIPDKIYFKELIRISINQIIWGGNYYLLEPTRCFLIWDKMDYNSDFASAELAWTSFNKVVKTFRHSRNSKEKRIHPTQKPVALYKWLLQNYAKPEDKILDTHVGSGSSRIACHEMGFDFTGYEIDKDYWQAQEDRFYHATRQKNLFDNEKKL